MGNCDAQALSAYYQSPEWAAKRNERLRIDGYRCAKCGFTRALEVHHINYERIFHEDVSRDLITLCKKCHAEIEAQKRAVNPVPVPVEHHSVYLAGKISSVGDWRNSFGNYRRTSVNPDRAVDDFVWNVNDYLTITGPFFISCDHGCYHGEGQHGVGAKDGGCCDKPYTQKDVLEICKKQIGRAEIVFAYIDCRDCYGTLAEIGYAHAMGKDVIVRFSSAELKEDMWFADRMQRNTGPASSEWIEKQLTSKLRRAIA